MVRLIEILLLTSIFICFAQLQPPLEFEVKNEQAIKYKEELLSAKLGEISTDLQIDYIEYADHYAQVDDLNTPNNALLAAINKYGRMLDVKEEVKQLYAHYKSTKIFDRNKNLGKFINDRRSIGQKLTFIINRANEIAKLYNNFFKISIKYAKMLRAIEDPHSEKNPKLWKDVTIEDKADLIKLINERLVTCTNLIEHCNQLQISLLNASKSMFDIFKELTDVSTMENFVKKFNDLSENEWKVVTDRSLRRIINILSGQLADVANPIYATLQKHNNEKETFKCDIIRWKEKAYQEEIEDDSDSSDESTLDEGKKIKLDIISKRMADYSNEAGREAKRIKTDKEEIDNIYINQISEFVLDEYGSMFGFDYQLDPFSELNKVKQDLLAGKNEYDLMRKDISDKKELIRFGGQWRAAKYKADRLNIGAEISRIGLCVNALSNLYAEAFGLAANIIKELKEIVNEADPNKKWENVYSDDKEELITFAKDGLIACTKLLGFCNDQRQAISLDLDRIEISLDSHNIEEIIENWKKTKNERFESLTQIKLVIDKLAGRRVAKAIFEDKHADCRKEFNVYFNGWYIFDWKRRAYTQSARKTSTLELTSETIEEIIEEYKKGIEDARLNEIANDLHMEYLLTDETDSGGSETIKNLDLVNDAIVGAISRYDEMVKVRGDIKRAFFDYQNICKRSRNLTTFEDDRRSIGFGITFIMARVSELAQMYNNFLTFSLQDVENLNEIIADPNISWGNVRIHHRIELVQKFTERLIPCTDLLRICDKLQPTALNALTEMRDIFNDLKNVYTDIEHFVNKFKIFLDKQKKDGVIGKNFRHFIDLLSNRIKKMPSQGQDIYNTNQKFYEMKESNLFDEDLFLWKIKVNLDESVPQIRKRKLSDILVVQPQPGVRKEQARRMKANKLQIDHEYLYAKIAVTSGDIYTSIDLLTPKNDLLAAINEYDSMLIDITAARKAFSELTTKIPTQWIDNEYIALKHNLGNKLTHSKKQIMKLAEAYEDVVAFATNIIKELTGIVFEEENFPWDRVDLDNKKELLEMVHIRLIACTRLLGSCNSLKQEISPDLIEVKNLFTNSQNQFELFIENLRELGRRFSTKAKEIKPVLDKLRHYIVVDLTKQEDEYGRYAFNKLLHSWRKDIIHWKLGAYSGTDKKDVVLYYERRSPVPEFEDPHEVQIRDYKAIIEEMDLLKISTDVKLEYELLDPSIEIADLNIPKTTILYAISCYNELLKKQNVLKSIFTNHQAVFSGVECLEKFKNGSQLIDDSVNTHLECSIEVDQAYDIFVTFSLKVITVLIEIVSSPSNPWGNVLIPHKAELLEIVNSRLIACADLLEHCNNLHTTVLNMLNPIINEFNALGDQTDVAKFQTFLRKCKYIFDKQGRSITGIDFKYRVNFLAFNKGTLKRKKDVDLYEKRQKYNEVESSFKKAIKEWKMKAYDREDDDSNTLNSSPSSPEPKQKVKRTKVIKELYENTFEIS